MAKRAKSHSTKKIRDAATKALAAQPFVDAARLAQDDDEPSILCEFREITDPKKRVYLQALTQYPRYGRAAKLAGISDSTGLNWRENHEDTQFQEALHVAMRLGLQRAESELWRRGIQGVRDGVWHKGKLVGTKRIYDTTAAIFMLKGAMPEKYREHYEVSGPSGGPIQYQQLGGLTNEQLRARLELLAQVLRSGQTPTTIDVTPPKDASTEELEARKATYRAELAKRNGDETP